MMEQLFILPDAVQEIAEARSWYDDRAAGLGEKFLLQVEDCMKRILAHPDLYETVYKQYRRALVRRFPYVIFYEYSRERTIVYSVFHTAQDPHKWRKRLP